MQTQYPLPAGNVLTAAVVDGSGYVRQVGNATIGGIVTNAAAAVYGPYLVDHQFIISNNCAVVIAEDSATSAEQPDPKTTGEYELLYDLTGTVAAVPGLSATIGETGVSQKYLIQVVADIVGESANYASIDGVQVTIQLAVNGVGAVSKVTSIPSDIAGSGYTGHLFTCIFSAVVETTEEATLSLRAAVSETPGSGSVRINSAYINAEKTATGVF